MPFSSVHEGTVMANGNTVISVSDVIFVLFIIVIIDVKKEGCLFVTMSLKKVRNHISP